MPKRKKRTGEPNNGDDARARAERDRKDDGGEEVEEFAEVSLSDDEWDSDEEGNIEDVKIGKRKAFGGVFEEEEDDDGSSLESDDAESEDSGDDAKSADADSAEAESSEEELPLLPQRLREFDGAESIKELAEAEGRAIGELAYQKDLFYDSEDSENERELNTIGNVPAEWYDDYEHSGYDLEGKKIGKKNTEGEIDRMLALEKHPWSVFNDKTGKRELISPADMAFIQSMKAGVQAERYAPEKWFIELNTYTDKIHATSQAPEPKSRFIPSKWEAKRVRRLAYAIKMGWIDLNKAKPATPEFYLMWNENEETQRNAFNSRHFAAPKPALPGHAESYNPPEEYLFDEEEKLAWEALDEEDRDLKFIPTKNKSLRTTPAYLNFQRERFERCLDLYMAVRSQRKRKHIDVDALTPKLPKPSELRPFPSQQSIVFRGHEGMVRSIDVDARGQWLLSGGEDGTVRVWESSTTREVANFSLPKGGKKAPVVATKVYWNPDSELCLFAVATPHALYFISPQAIATPQQKETTDRLFSVVPSNQFKEKVLQLVRWEKPTGSQWDEGYRLIIHFTKKASELTQVEWHRKGDYFATVCPNGKSGAVLIHQLSKQISQNPFEKSKGIIQTVRFHPQKPFFFVATQRHVRVYNLAEQKLQKKLMSGVQWISDLHIHPQGDNLLIGSYDARVCWFDMDMGTKPYKVLKYHKLAVRATRFHSRYPLFASASDDGTVHIFHGRVYDDLMQNPFIVPLKILRGHEIVSSKAGTFGVMDVAFHTSQPWIYTAGADGTVRLWV